MEALSGSQTIRQSDNQAIRHQAIRQSDFRLLASGFWLLASGFRLQTTGGTLSF